MKTVVFGKNGQVAQSLKKYFPQAEFFGRDAANFESPSSVVAILDRVKPELVINAAAYTNVDRAEIEPGKALLVNAETPGSITKWCKREKASLIHFSTD